MKLKNLITLNEKKEAIATAGTINVTLHLDEGFKQVGDGGSPETNLTVSVSSTGGKDFYRPVSDKEESLKINEAVRIELRRALRRFDKHVQYIVDKYKLQSKEQ